MPILNNPIDLRYEGKTHSQLVVSEGKAPAEKYLPSDAENANVKFNYAFGPEYNKEVVIPKGKIVEAAGIEYDVVTEKYVPRIKISAGANPPLGVNHHNVYQRKRDRFAGNAPTVITRDYIRVPLFVNSTGATAKTAATAIKFGAMWAEADPSDKAAVATAIYGKYVVSDDAGNFSIPANLATARSGGLIVGQVLGLELDLPPAGYLQYFTEMSDTELAELIRQSREVTSPGRRRGSDLEIDTFPQGSGYLKSPEDLAWILKDFRQGIPFLTDGYFKARTDVTIDNTTWATEVADVRVAGDSNVAVSATGALTVVDPVGSAIFIKLKDKFATTKLQDTSVVGDFPELGGQVDKLSIKINNVDVSPANYEIDYYNNMLVIYPQGAHTAEQITITVTLLKNQIPGIPTGWDFPGCFGEARILLQR